ncbi:ABC transporter substrate-binding protein [Halorubrum lipolyticum]|uniref:Periplasmic binding protein n=1 Tax=Halorubrum lipolyticum DSM 21995 TaxID=1227482 RepID=M0NN94_9EURY|nr:ABC transporter substrate-binding protein [Halorubrum lipolyticum]EMA59271.1 periplasmic binding protein [Halorubrum lipolyticum DSM 21995]
MTVVSLFPSATELAAAIGATPAAVSHQCDHPPPVEDRPALTGLIRDLDADPADLDRIAAHDDTYYLDGDRLAAADPDVILTQGVCAVCALDAGLARRAVERLGLDAAVIDVHADDLDDVLANVERVGEAVGRPAAAAALRDDLDARIDAVTDAVPSDDARPRVAVLDWTDPLRHAGLWVPDLIRIAGGEPGIVASGERSRKVDPDELRDFDPEVVVVGPCSADVVEAERAAADLLARAPLDDVAAVRDGRVYAMDGTAYLNRHSHRVVDALEALAAVIRPDRFEGTGEKVRRVDTEPTGTLNGR